MERNKTNDTVWLVLFLIVAMHIFTVVKLVETRHEVRMLTGEVRP